MLRTNTKKAKNNVKEYIKKIYCGDSVDYSNHDFITDTDDFEKQKDMIRKIFYLEVGHFRNNQIGRYNAFKEWCQGLPSIIDTCYYYNRSAIKDLGDILEETEEERNKFSEEQAEEKLTYLIYKELYY